MVRIVTIINLIIFSLFNLQSQNPDEVTWDITLNRMDKPLIAGFPFVLNLIHFDTAKSCKDENLNLLIEKIEIKRKDKPLSYSFPIYKRGENDYFVNFTKVLKENEVYNIKVMCDRFISAKEIEELKNSFTKDNYMLNEFILNIFIELEKNGLGTKHLQFVLNEFIPIEIAKKVNTYNCNYYFRENIYPESFYSSFLPLMDYIDNNDTLMINRDDSLTGNFSIYKNFTNIIFKNRINNSKNSNNEVLYSAFTSKLDLVEKSLLEQLNNVFSKINIGNVLASSFNNKLTDRVSRKLITHYGLGMASNLRDKSYTFANIGINYFFKPINNNYPISLHQGSEFSKRISLHASTTFFEIGPNFIDNKERFGILNDQTFTFGLGYLIDDGILFNLGATLYNQRIPHPLITEQKLALLPTVSLNIDNALRGIFKSLKK